MGLGCVTDAFAGKMGMVPPPVLVDVIGEGGHYRCEIRANGVGVSSILFGVGGVRLHQHQHNRLASALDEEKIKNSIDWNSEFL